MTLNLTPPLSQSCHGPVWQEAECAFSISAGVHYFTPGSKLTFTSPQIFPTIVWYQPPGLPSRTTPDRTYLLNGRSFRRL